MFRTKFTSLNEADTIMYLKLLIIKKEDFSMSKKFNYEDYKHFNEGCGDKALNYDVKSTEFKQSLNKLQKDIASSMTGSNVADMSDDDILGYRDCMKLLNQFGDMLDAQIALEREKASALDKLQDDLDSVNEKLTEVLNKLYEVKDEDK